MSGEAKLPAITVLAPKCCGGCACFRKNPQMIGHGLCYYAPPTCVPIMAGNVPSITAARPPVQATEPACAHWRPADGD